MGRSEELLTRRQLSVLMLFSMISPLFRQVPRSVLAWAGAWTVPAVLVGVGAFLLTVAAAGALWSRWGRGEGLGEALLRSLGNGVGRAVLALYTLWFSFYAGFVLRSGAERFVSAVYTEMPVALLMAVLMLPVVTAALGRGKVLARCAELLLPLVLGVLVLVFVLAAPGLRWEELWPVQGWDTEPIVRGALPVLDTLLLTAYCAFLDGRTESGSALRTWLAPALILSALAVALCVTTVGCFGAPLAARMNAPFFVLLRNLRLFHLLERFEAPVIAQWVATDFVLLALLLQLASQTLSLTLHGRDARRAPIHVLLCTILCVASGAFCARDAFAVRALAETLVPMLNAVFLAMLPLALVIGRIRGR